MTFYQQRIIRGAKKRSCKTESDSYNHQYKQTNITMGPTPF